MGNGVRDPFIMDPSKAQNSTSSQLQQSIERVKNEWNNRRKVWQWWQHIRPQEERRRARWRIRVGEFLESTAVHAGILILLLVDLLATAVDILKTLHNKSHDLNNCTRLVESCQCVAHFEKSESFEFLYWVGIVILCLLLLNVGGLLVAFGVSFFGHPGYILDLVVLSTALCLEIFLDAETAGLLVILTLWRIVRVAHGIFEVTDETLESEIHRIETQFEALEANNKQMQQLLKDKDATIAHLQLQLQQWQVDTQLSHEVLHYSEEQNYQVLNSQQ